jgi:phosphoadenosine phosphosulfate reductase
MDRAMREQHPTAWLRGVRASQTEDRAKMKIVEWVERHKCWAISPILRWSTREIFAYMKENGLPHHPLWERGYTSIGCSPETCTRPVGAGEDDRAGRWAGSEKKECGIHLDLGSGI